MPLTSRTCWRYLRFVRVSRDPVAGSADAFDSRRRFHLAQRVLDHIAGAAEPIAALANVPAPPRAGHDWKAFVAPWADIAIRTGRPTSSVPALVRATSRPDP